MVDLLSLVFYGKCQLASTVLDSEHEAHWKISGPQATLIKSDCLIKHIHISGHFGHFVALAVFIPPSLHKEANVGPGDGLRTIYSFALLE